MVLHARSVIGTPTPPSSRPKLRQVRVLLAHEVGVATNEERGRYRSSDPKRVLDDARAAAAYGVAAGKPWEYSWMLGRDGAVFTQAGEYRAAHCLNFNAESAGVIFLNALGLAPTEAQIEAWWFLRGHAVDLGVLAADHEVWPHYRYRATSCPGVLATTPGARWNAPSGDPGARLGHLIDALTVPAVLPPPLPAPDPDPIPSPLPEVFRMLIIVGNDANHSDPRRWVWDGGSVMRLLTSEADYNRLLERDRVGLVKLHPAFSTLASPFWMSASELREYGQVAA